MSSVENIINIDLNIFIVVLFLSCLAIILLLFWLNSKTKNLIKPKKEFFDVLKQPTELLELVVLWRFFWWGFWDIIPWLNPIDNLPVYGPLTAILTSNYWSILLVFSSIILFILILYGELFIRIFIWLIFACFWTWITLIFATNTLNTTAIPSYGYSVLACLICGILVGFRHYDPMKKLHGNLSRNP